MKVQMEINLYNFSKYDSNNIINYSEVSATLMKVKGSKMKVAWNEVKNRGNKYVLAISKA